MSLLPSFADQAEVAVIGASGGIGGAFVELLAGDERVGMLHAFSRTPMHPRTDRMQCHGMDVTDEESVRRGAAAVGSPLDLVVVCSGILHQQERVRPEKTMRELSAASMLEVFAVNSVAPAILAKHFLPLLRRDAKSVFAALSARVGSIQDNRLGGWATYRASKAALNMLIKTLAIEQSRANPHSIVVALHPGTVDTALSRPFTGRVPASRLFTPQQSAGCLLEVMNGLTANDSGGFFAWDGSVIDY